MLALSIRQPYAELRNAGDEDGGQLDLSWRSRPTRIVGERFYLYASKGGGDWRKAARLQTKQGKAWSLDLAMPNDGVGSVTLPPWMTELANGLRLFPEDLRTGVIVGSAVIEKVTPREDGMFQWHLAHVERAKRFRKPKGHPQPVWFEPF